jgi:hypothetical protein
MSIFSSKAVQAVVLAACSAAIAGCSSGGGSGSSFDALAAHNPNHDPGGATCADGSFKNVAGAIFTTDSTCEITNENVHYEDKCDVYLNGGPDRPGSAGLPDGTYYFQITDPSGATLLAGPEPTGGVPDTSEKVIVVEGGEFTECIQLCPYLTTPNPGGEYKVWVTPTDAFNEDWQTSPASGESFGFEPCESKTDNFKVDEEVVEPCPGPSIDCPDDIVVECIGFTMPELQGTVNCPGDFTVVSTHPVGFEFPVGVTVVTVTLTDSQGQTATCTFTVTVLAETAGS